MNASPRRNDAQQQITGYVRLEIKNSSKIDISPKHGDTLPSTAIHSSLLFKSH